MSESTPKPPGTADTRAQTAPTVPIAPAPDTGGTRSIALAALLLAALALALAIALLFRSNEAARRLEQERAENPAREQRGADSERRIAELERQWARAQAEADVAPVQVTDAELRRRRDQLALLDIERVVEQAQLQLRLGTGAGAAIDALSAADARLARLGSATAQRVQSALRHDLARLRASPDIDRGTLAARLDPLLGAVDGWRASSELGRAASRAPAAPVPVRPADRSGESAGARLRSWLGGEFGDLLRIREVDTPEALLLGPVQQQILRDRFRLGVLDLRQAILARDERAIRTEESTLELLLTRYFDPGQTGVSAALAQLRATLAAALPGAPLSLDETMGALRAARGAGQAP